MNHKITLRRECKTDDLFITSGNVLECGNCGERDDEVNN